jgi:type IV pilus assembly protein PilN
MIKVNLLLPRKEKKKVGIKKEITVLTVAVVLLFIGLGAYQWKIHQNREEILGRIATTKNEINHVKSLSTEVNRAKEDQRVLQEKLNVINSLRKEKASPAKILEEVSVQKPEKIHLESLRKEGSRLGIEGVALDDETVANFMTNLRKSNLFRNIDLIVSEQSEQSRVKLKKFTLSCEIRFL